MATQVELSTGKTVTLEDVSPESVVGALRAATYPVRFESVSGPVFINPAHVVQIYST